MKITNKKAEKILSGLTKDSLKIDTEKVSNEILDWLITNVESFIDNQTKNFKIDLIIDGVSVPPMPETRKLQDLFRDIPDDQNLVNASSIYREDGEIDMAKLDTKSMNSAAALRVDLNGIVEECHNKITKNQEKLEQLYKRMSYFYEMIGFYNGNALIREIEGAVNISKFEYEAFSVDVHVKTPTFQINKGNGETKIIESQSKDYTIQEGFTVWIEISFAPKLANNSIF